VTLDAMPRSFGSRVSCDNCGREYVPSDGLAALHLTTTSLVGLRGLLAGPLATVPCPACSERLPFEPVTFVFGIDPRVGYAYMGNALTEAGLDEAIRFLQERAAGGGRALEVRTYGSLADLRTALEERFMQTARAMRPLNEASGQDRLSQFLLEKWRTITPEVLVASDLLTLIAHVLAAETPAAREEGVRYFTQHARSLAMIQAKTWVALSLAWAAPSPPAGSLERDLRTFVDPVAIFDEAVEYLKETVQACPDSSTRLLYTLCAVLALAQKARGKPNALAGPWSNIWFSSELKVEDRDPEVVSRWEPLRLSREAVAGTLDPRALFDDAGRALAPLLERGDRGEIARLLDAIARIGRRAGLPDLASDLIGKGISMGLAEPVNPARAIEALDRLLGRTATAARNPPPLEAALTLVCTQLVAANDALGVKAVLDHALPYAQDWSELAALESWYGAALLRMHRSELFLEQVGTTERDWERTLLDADRGRLWNERANALRASGRYAETVAWRRRVERLYSAKPRSSNHRAALRALAIAEREAGAPDRALEILLPLLDDKGSLDRIQMLDTAAATWIALGDHAKARAAVEEAIALATGPDAHERPRFEALLASLRRDKVVAERERALLAASREGWRNPVTLLHELAAWVNLRAGAHELSQDGLARLSDALAEVRRLLEGDLLAPSLREDAYILLARAGERLGLVPVNRLWSAAADAADALGLVPKPDVVIEIARHSYRTQDLPTARAVLVALPSALARSIQNVERMDVALGALAPLGPRLDTLTEELLLGGLNHDARAVAEFRRDAMRRAIGHRDVALEAREFLAGRLFGPALDEGPTAVLEFLSVTRGLVPLLTFRPAGQHRPQTLHLDAPDLNVFDLRDRIVNRLQSWVSSRPGDPFQVRHWPEFRAWLRDALARAMPEGGHLAVIESEGLEGIPFHVALAPERSCSYASSWTTLVHALTLRTSATGGLGFAMVPAFSDDARVGEAMERTGESLRTLAAHLDLPYAEARGAACDAKALSDLLAANGVCFVACHGFLHETRREVAWVLAHHGGLPGKSGALVVDGERAPNHLSWRDLERLEATPWTVISAACSSGRALAGGIGERIGLFQSLANGGTRTLVAPAWDVEADAVLPIAFHALRLHLEEHRPIAEAVRMASEAASHALPAWCAWSLTVEGAWR
jgi:tetratricopeptide (TPR) repeat protein